MSEGNPKDILRDVEYWDAGSGKTVQSGVEPPESLIVGQAKPEDPRELAQHIADAAQLMNTYQQMSQETNFVEDNIDKWFSRAMEMVVACGEGETTDELERAQMMLLLSHHALGIANEAGEVAGKVKKLIRDKQGYLTFGDIDDVVKEMGDVLWYMAALCTALDVSLSDVAAGNLTKLFSRKERGVLSGSGDNR